MRDEHKKSETSSDESALTLEKVAVELPVRRGSRRRNRRKFLQSIDIGTLDKGRKLNKNMLHLSPLNSTKKKNLNRSIQLGDSSVSDRDEKERTR